MDNYNMLVTKISSKMGKPVHCVSLGYEAPWSSKAGQKKRPIYLIPKTVWTILGYEHEAYRHEGRCEEEEVASRRRAWSCHHIHQHVGGCSRKSHLPSFFSITHRFADRAKASGDVLAIKYRTTREAESMGIDAKASAQGKESKPPRRSPPRSSVRTTIACAISPSMVLAPSTALRCSRNTRLCS